jgi:hypothetical protein
MFLLPRLVTNHNLLTIRFSPAPADPRARQDSLAAVMNPSARRTHYHVRANASAS